MAVFAGVTGSDIQQTAVSLCKSLRDVLRRADEVQAYLSGLSLTDLQGLGIAAADAQDIKTAIADASALSGIYNTGQPPGTYPQAASAYIYAASQRVIIGPA